MKLPNGDRAFVDIEKLRGYCLNPFHEEGKHKARLFAAKLGMTVHHSEQLQAILMECALTEEAQQSPRNDYGTRCTIDLEIQGLNGLETLRSAWIILDHEDFPRLTSCYLL